MEQIPGYEIKGIQLSERETREVARALGSQLLLINRLQNELRHADDTACTTDAQVRLLEKENALLEKENARLKSALGEQMKAVE